MSTHFVDRWEKLRRRKHWEWKQEPYDEEEKPRGWRLSMQQKRQLAHWRLTMFVAGTSRTMQAMQWNRRQLEHVMGAWQRQSQVFTRGCRLRERERETAHHASSKIRAMLHREQQGHRSLRWTTARAGLPMMALEGHSKSNRVYFSSTAMTVTDAHSKTKLCESSMTQHDQPMSTFLLEWVDCTQSMAGRRTNPGSSSSWMNVANWYRGSLLCYRLDPMPMWQHWKECEQSVLVCRNSADRKTGQYNSHTPSELISAPVWAQSSALGSDRLLHISTLVLTMPSTLGCNCPSNCTSTAAQMACAAFQTRTVPAEDARCAQNTAVTRWDTRNIATLRETTRDFMLQSLDSLKHLLTQREPFIGHASFRFWGTSCWEHWTSSDLESWSKSTPTSLHSSWMRSNGRGFVSRSAGLRSVGIFTTTTVRPETFSELIRATRKVVFESCK